MNNFELRNVILNKIFIKSVICNDKCLVGSKNIFIFMELLRDRNEVFPVTAPKLEAHDRVEACDDIDGKDDDTGAVTAADAMLDTAGATAAGVVNTAVLGTIMGNWTLAPPP